MKKVNQEYEMFKKMFSTETGIAFTDERIPMLMKQLKRAENKLHRVYLDQCNLGESQTRSEIASQLESHAIDLLRKYKTIKVTFNSDPRGGAIRLIFTKTKWYNTLGSDVAVDW